MPGPALSLVEAALGRFGGAVVTEVAGAGGTVPVSLYLTQEPARPALTALLAAAALAAGIPLPEAEVERLPETDWVAESQRGLPAVQAGPFYIYGSHVEAAPPPGSIPLLIEASAAFGTGRHKSTRGCLLALAELRAARRGVTRALDVGCGTGILAIAAAKVWSCLVIAVDLDRRSADLARENARRNGVADLVRAALGRGFTGELVAGHGPYDLILENILAEPICAMAPDLARHLAPGGVAVLSGILRGQEAQVLAAHAGLRLLSRIDLAEWVTLVLEA